MAKKYTAEQLAEVMRAKGIDAASIRARRAKGKATSDRDQTAKPETRCPACHSPAEKIDETMVMADRDSIRSLIASRRARRGNGDLAEQVAAEDLAERLRTRAELDRAPVEGEDRCPACGAESVEVNTSVLSPSGQIALMAGRQQQTAGSVAEIRRRKGATSRREVEEHNERMARRRAALRGEG
ncbi:hypothetical protein [Gordonia iterans]